MVKGVVKDLAITEEWSNLAAPLFFLRRRTWVQNQHRLLICVHGMHIVAEDKK